MFTRGVREMGASQSAGVHIIMDARVRDPVVFERSALVDLFDEVVKALGMTALDEVKVYEVPVDPAILERVKRTGNFEDEGGISTIQVISTSHLTLHAWPLQKYFALDAFSCKDYDAEFALDLIRKRLGATGEVTIVVRRRKPEEYDDTRSVSYIEA